VDLATPGFDPIQNKQDVDVQGQLHSRGIEMFEKFNNYLQLEFSEDFWSDEGITQAASMVSQFTESDWVTLFETIAQQSELWMIRCSEALGDKGDKSSLTALLKLITVGSQKVIVAALDSINSIASQGMDILLYKQEIQSSLDKVVKNADSVTRPMLSSLQSKLK